MRNLNWYQARHLAKVLNKKVRRWDWRRWTVWTGYYLWFTHQPYLPPVDAIPATPEDWRVVQNEDFTAAEFLANDWTDEPWDTPFDGGPHSCPEGYVYDPFTNSCVLVDSGSGGGTPPASPIPGATPGDILPDEGPGWAQIGNLPGDGGMGGPPPPPPPPGGPGGGGGGDVWWPPLPAIPPSGGPGVDEPPPPHDPPAEGPVISGYAVDISGADCYNPPGPDTIPVWIQVNITGGPSGVGSVSMSIGAGPSFAVSTGWNGMSMVYETTAVYSPGGTITYRVTYTDSLGAVHTFDIIFTMPPYCYTP